MPSKLSFRPPFCPNPRCKYHHNPVGWRFRRIGFFTRLQAPHRIQRYLCSHCRRSFSSQTFSPTYWLKRADLLATLYDRINNCSCFRQIARCVGVSPSTVMNHAARLGRHCLLFHQLRRPKRAPDEPFVIDGFESFEFSQFYPLHVNLAAGSHSQFLYAFTDAELRRKGRKTSRQKRKQHQDEARYGRPDPKAIEHSVADLLSLALPAGSKARVRSDEHRAYPRAIRRLHDVTIVHEMTSSKRARTYNNPLFPVNRMDLLLRHQSANHKRETIAYSKRRQAVMERLAMFAVWHNFQKLCSENKKDGTPAQRLGLWSGRLSTARLLRDRLFPSQIQLPAVWRGYYDRTIVTRRIPNGKQHRLTYAY
jgi:transposase-like protein